MPKRHADGRPKGKVTAYAFFIRHQHEVNKHVQIPFSEFSKQCSEIWKTLPDNQKLPFQEQADGDRIRHEHEMMIWKQNGGADFGPGKKKAVNGNISINVKNEQNIGNIQSNSKIKNENMLISENHAHSPNMTNSLNMQNTPPTRKGGGPGSRGGKRKRTDPNQPRRPQTAFFIFAAANRDQVREANPNFRITDTAKELGRLWREVDAPTKAEFQKLADAEREEYQRRMEEYRANKERENQINLENEDKIRAEMIEQQEQLLLDQRNKQNENNQVQYQQVYQELEENDEEDPNSQLQTIQHYEIQNDQNNQNNQTTYQISYNQPSSSTNNSQNLTENTLQSISKTPNNQGYNTININQAQLNRGQTIIRQIPGNNHQYQVIQTSNSPNLQSNNITTHRINNSNQNTTTIRVAPNSQLKLIQNQAIGNNQILRVQPSSNSNNQNRQPLPPQRHAIQTIRVHNNSNNRLVTNTSIATSNSHNSQNSQSTGNNQHLQQQMQIQNTNNNSNQVNISNIQNIAYQPEANAQGGYVYATEDHQFYHQE